MGKGVYCHRLVIVNLCEFVCAALSDQISLVYRTHYIQLFCVDFAFLTPSSLKIKIEMNKLNKVVSFITFKTRAQTTSRD